MKKTIFLLFLFVATGIAHAQTQQGIVKTRGRIVNGQLKPGTKLSGATITLNIGNPQVSGQNGAFSFNVPTGKNYSLVAAKKQGYTLADPEYTLRSFKYSAGNPFYVMLEDENQRQADIREATDKVRRTLKREIRKREDELDELRETNAITQGRYDSLRAEFNTYRQKSEDLVKEMAERYASTDYDQLDEFNQQVQMYIEEGELQKADSMIRSKGDMEQRIAEYRNVVAANKIERDVLRHQEDNLRKSEQAAVKTYTDLCQDLSRRHDIFIQEHNPDSALYCQKLVADLDTTNVWETYDYAYSAIKRFLRDEALKYTFMTIRNARAQGIQDILPMAENLLGVIYMNMNRLDESKEMYLLCIDHLNEMLNRSNNAHYRHHMTMPIVNLAYIYTQQGNLHKAEEYYLRSLTEHKELVRENYKAFIWDYIWTEDKVSSFYTDARKYDEAEEHLNIALSFIADSITFPHNIERNLWLHATVLDHLAWLKYQVGDYHSSNIQYKCASKYLEELYNNSPVKTGLNV